MTEEKDQISKGLGDERACPDAPPMPTGCAGIPSLFPASYWRERAEAAERWQREVADGLGYLNRPEGQGGYEVAEPAVIVKAFRELRADLNIAESRKSEAFRDLHDRALAAEKDVDRLCTAAVRDRKELEQAEARVQERAPAESPESAPLRSDGKPMCRACCNTPLCCEHKHYRPEGCPECGGSGIARAPQAVRP